MTSRSQQQTARIRVALPGFLATLLASGLLLLAASPALALGPPTVSKTSFSEITTSSAELKATVNPNGKKTTYRFEYITEAAWKADGEEFLPVDTKATPTEMTEAELSTDHPVSVLISELSPATAYRFRLFTHNGSGDHAGETVAFSTYATPLDGLPDGRAYEQASPVNKDGGDATGTVEVLKAADEGNGVIFGTSAGIPGGEGAQSLPLFLADRGPGGWLSAGLLPPAGLGPNAGLLGWTPDFSEFFQFVSDLRTPRNQAMFMRSASGSETQVTPYFQGREVPAFAGASADGSVAVFESRTRLPEEEGKGPLPGSVEGHSNVYAWDRESGRLSLAGQMNSEAETAAKLAAGAFAGPYDWAKNDTSQGGAKRNYYTQDTHAVAGDGSVFFTAAGSGHLYERLNPTQPQSDMSGEECTEPARACTIDVLASHRATPDAGGHQPAAFQYATPDASTALFTTSEKLTNDANTGPEVPPAAIGRVSLNGSEEAEEELDNYFEGAHGLGVAVDGEHIYWVDPNKGTIARAKLNGSGRPIEIDESFVDVAAEETCAETRPYLEPGIEQCGPSIPRYVAVRGEYVYWTNTGPLAGEVNHTRTEEPALAAGTIGRAKINPETEEIEEIKPKFIAGVSDPQGIAVNSEHIYWANSLRNALQTVSEEYIGRATIEGEDVEQRFHNSSNRPFGLVLSATGVYWASESPDGYNVIEGIPLEGGSLEVTVAGQNLEARGVAVAGNHLYWTDQATGAIGRIRLPLEELSDPISHLCSEIPRCEPEFIKPGGALLGLASDASGSHLYWSANGEAPPHPGNDLYRFRRKGTGGCEEAGGCLTDLAPLPSHAGEENGAEVLGVLGASSDASRVYFVANGVLSETPNEAGEIATPGTCRGRIGANVSGRCNLYLWEGGTSSFVARLDPEGDGDRSDALDWVPSSFGVYPTGKQKTAFASADGKTLLFRSRAKLTGYDNNGTPELYLYRLEQGISCVSCLPTGAPPRAAPTFGSIEPFLLSPFAPATVASRDLSADGHRAFFETTDPLVADDTNGVEGCPNVGNGGQVSFTCDDVYEWEAPAVAPSPGYSCTDSSPTYSPPNGGCLYLISRGKGDYPTFLADADEAGGNVFFLSREQLVGQDTDGLVDVYDARVGGGLAAQNPPSESSPCEGEACKPGSTAPPEHPSPITSSFQGGGSRSEKHCVKGRVRRKGRCAKPHKHKSHHRRHRRAHR
jgi:hypothetical protein